MIQNQSIFCKMFVVSGGSDSYNNFMDSTEILPETGSSWIKTDKSLPVAMARLRLLNFGNTVYAFGSLVFQLR